MWNLETGLEFVRTLERELLGSWHCALGGGVLHRGESEHDLDVVIFAHDNTNRDMSALRHSLWALQMKRKADKESMWEHWRTKGSRDDKHVEVWLLPDGRRVDLLILQ